MNQKVLNILKVVVFFLLVVDLEAQEAEKIKLLNTKKYKLNHQGMIVLTTWSSVNILSGADYFMSNDTKERNFYAMNAAWGVVNLSIALPSLLIRPKEEVSMQKLKENQRRTENIFLINSILDVAYVGGGFTLKHLANLEKYKDKKEQFDGFGNSILLQGSALLIFDTSMYLLNRNFRKKELPGIENIKVAFTPNYIQIGYKF